MSPLLAPLTYVDSYGEHRIARVGRVVPRLRLGAARIAVDFVQHGEKTGHSAVLGHFLRQEVLDEHEEQNCDERDRFSDEGLRVLEKIAPRLQLQQDCPVGLAVQMHADQKKNPE